MGKVWGEQKSKFHIDTPDSVCDTQSENCHQTRLATVHEMARDEARHGKAFEGLLKRYFNK